MSNTFLPHRGASINWLNSVLVLPAYIGPLITKRGMVGWLGKVQKRSRNATQVSFILIRKELYRPEKYTVTTPSTSLFLHSSLLSPLSSLLLIDGEETSALVQDVPPANREGWCRRGSHSMQS